MWCHTTYYEVGDIETSSLVTISSDATLKVAMEAMFSNGRLQIGIVEGDELRGILLETLRDETTSSLHFLAELLPMFGAGA